MNYNRLIGRAGLLLAGSLAVACHAQSTAPAFGRAVDVRLGASVRMPGDTTTVRFTDVTGDSRCPQGAQCIWAGEGVVLFTVGGATPVTLRTMPARGPTTVIVSGLRFTLVALTPAPKLGQGIAKGDYVATIRFDEVKD